MERFLRGDDFVPARVVAEFARELVQHFVRFRAAVAEKDFARSRVRDELVRKFALPLMVVKIRKRE